MTRNGCVYLVRCPDTGSPVYVGQTIRDPEDRLSAHISSAKTCAYGRAPFWVWLRTLHSRPIVEVLVSNCQQDLLGRLEAAALASLLRSGHRMLNVRDPESTVPHYRRKPRMSKYIISYR